MNIFTWKFGRREHGNKKKKEKKMGGSIRSIVKNEISPVVSGEREQCRIPRWISIDVIPIGNQSHLGQPNLFR